MVDLNEKIFFEKRLRKSYKKFIPKKEIKQNMRHIIDVGANKGQSIDFFLSLNPNANIFALEPNFNLFNFLKNKYKKNKKIHIFNLGISDVDGRKVFQENILDQTSSFEDLNYASNYLKKKAKVLGIKIEDIIKKKYEVEVCTLSSFIKKNCSSVDIDVLKVDTEGHEYSCLKGLFLEKPTNLKIKRIQFEYHADDLYKNSVNILNIIQLLENNNFFEEFKVKHGFGNFFDYVFKKI